MGERELQSWYKGAGICVEDRRGKRNEEMREELKEILAVRLRCNDMKQCHEGSRCVQEEFDQNDLKIGEREFEEGFKRDGICIEDSSSQ